MDALEKFLGGGQAVAEPPKKSGGQTPSDAQAKREQTALAMIKEELRKNQELAAQGNKEAQINVAALNREIARFEKRSPAAKKAASAAPVVAVAPVAQAATSDPLEAFLSGKAAPPAQPAAQPTTQPATQPAVISGSNRYQGYSAEEEQKAGKVKTKPPVVRQIIADVLKKGFQTRQELGERTAGAVQEFGERAAGVVDTLYGVVPATYGAVTQAFARTAQTPEQAEKTGQVAASAIDKPIGKAFGITGKETYQKPLGGITEPVAEQINKMFNVLGMTPEQISEKTGIPAADIRNMVVIGSVALPQAVKEIAPVVGKVAEVAKQTKVGQQLTQAAEELEIVRPGELSKAQAQAQFEAKQAPAGSAGAAAVEQNPLAGKITGEETIRGSGVGAVFPQVKLTKIPKDVPVPEQQLRSQLFQEVLPNLKPRPGVVTGNDNLLRNEHGLANMAEPSPLGMKLKEQIANEQVGFSNYAQERVNATGARSTFTNDEQRGNFLNDVAFGKNPDDIAPSSFTGYLNQVKQDTYKSAFERMGSNRINSSHADDLFVDPQVRATFRAAGTLELLKSAKDLIQLAKTDGFNFPDGTKAAPGSVAAFDHVRKVFNSPKVWTPEKAASIREINQAIDKDIAAVADPALYKLGDKIHQAEKTILGSTGFKRLFGEVDANGNVTSKVAPEKLLSSLNNLRKDEWRHIRDTFSELANGRVRGAPEGLPPVPPELRQAAAAAVAEMDGALAREVYKAGASKVGEWNSNSVNNMLTSIVGEKILETFPPSEIQKFGALNYVGQFTPGLKYEGAGQQTRRISLLEKNYPAFGATVGSGLGAVIGETPISPEAGVGAFLGREAGAYLQTKKAAKEEAKAVKKMEKEMEKAKALGQQSGQNKLNELKK
jgi:hypothetical protein